MKIDLFLRKSLEDNASFYFDRAKKAKKKLESIDEVLSMYKKKLDRFKRKSDEEDSKEEDVESVYVRKFEWYEKFRWFYSSSGFLVIGGRDATTNEIIIKKHTGEGDLVFHTDMAGSPFFVIKSGKNEIPEKDIKEVASATACYSKAWKAGHLTASVFYVNPDQVTKEAQSGEFLSKGSFMIRGKTNYVIPEMKIAIGFFNGFIIGGPVDSISSQTDNYVVVLPGDNKTGGVAKKIKSRLGGGDLDDIIKFIPPGGCVIQNSRK